MSHQMFEIKIDLRKVMYGKNAKLLHILKHLMARNIISFKHNPNKIKFKYCQIIEIFDLKVIIIF